MDTWGRLLGVNRRLFVDVAGEFVALAFYWSWQKKIDEDMDVGFLWGNIGWGLLVGKHG